MTPTTKAAVIEALSGVVTMKNAGQLEEFVGEPWLERCESALSALRSEPEPTPEPGEREAFQAWCDGQPIKPFPMHMAAKAFGAGWQARASLPPAPTNGTIRPAQQPDTDGTAPPPPRA